MKSSKITLAIVAPSQEICELLRQQVLATGMVSVALHVDQYCTSKGDRSTRLLVEERPNIVLVDLAEPQQALESLKVLNIVLPESWLFVCSDAPDSQLIIESMRAGAREFLTKPMASANLSQALARFLADQQRSQENTGSGEIFCVTSAKGGAGATSVAINLAAVLSGVPDTRVCLLDLNSPVGDAAAYLNLNSQFTVNDALANANRLDGVLLETYMSRAHGVAVLPGVRDFHPGRMAGVDALAKLLEVVSSTYTHAILDVPALFEEEYLKLLVDVSSTIIIVLTPELPALWRTDRLIRYLANYGGIDKIRLVINRAGKHDEISDSEIEKALNYPVYWRLPNDYNAAIRSINSGKPLVSQNHSTLSQSYRELAQRLTGVTVPERRRGLMGLFSSSSS